MAGKAVAGKNSKSKSGCSCRKNGSSSREELVAGRTVAVAVKYRSTITILTNLKGGS